jgi:hemolysin activation/secretion protein
VSAELSEGLPVLDATRRDDPLASRPGASNTFTKAVFTASRLQDLGRGFALLGAVSAQTAFGGRLLSSEQFALGGQQFGRGYDPSEITGDSGVAGKVELQKTLLVPAFGPALPAQLFGFYDAGEVMSQVASSAGVPARESLASAGAGVRINLGHGLVSSLELAKPLTRAVAAEVGHESDPKGVRAYFTLAAGF